MLKMKLRWSKREKYTPPNPSVPEFTSPGGADLWKLVIEIYAMQKSQAVEIRLLGLAILAVAGAALARSF